MSVTPDFFGGDIAIDDEEYALELMSQLRSLSASSESLVSYKAPRLGLSKETIPTFSIFSRSNGILLIDLVNQAINLDTFDEEIWKLLDGTKSENQDINLDNFEQELINRVKDEPLLFDRKNRGPLFKIQKLLVFCENGSQQLENLNSSYSSVIHFSTAQDVIRNFLAQVGTEMPQDKWDRLISVTDGSHFLERDRKKEAIQNPITKNDFIKFSLNRTFKLDLIQRKVALELPQGPQRIRGLAGTGKTVILCMKAAIAHASYPDFKILYAFHTQSLYQIVKRYISKYFEGEARKGVDETKLHVSHSWGGRTTLPGVYSRLCEEYGVRPLRLQDTRYTPDPVEFIFRDLLEKVGDKLKPTYDLVLIDEAQDLPPAFFETIYRITKDPKRIVWAYDEFQSLKDVRIKEPEDLFGKLNGVPNISNADLVGEYKGGIKKDFILPNSYRNPRYNLVIAHSFGLGIYSPQGIVDSLENKSSWQALGYRQISPNKETYEEGDEIVLTREESTSKNILEDALKKAALSAGRNSIERTVNFQNTPLASVADEIEVATKHIKNLIEKDNIPPQEIAVISLARSGSKAILTRLRQRLDSEGIQSITPGIVESSSLYKKDGSVTLAVPYRAKGNESFVVIVLGADEIYRDPTFRLRNALFVSITRSLGWCFVIGSGENQKDLLEEFAKIDSSYPNLKFTYPSEDQLKRRRMILSQGDAELKESEKQIEEILGANEDLLIEILKTRPDLLEKIRKADSKK